MIIIRMCLYLTLTKFTNNIIRFLMLEDSVRATRICVGINDTVITHLSRMSDVSEYCSRIPKRPM